MSTLRLCILENGLVPEPLRGRFGSYPAMIQAWLSPVLPEAEFHRVSVVAGEPLPEPSDFDGYVLTGSRHSVYERADWMQAEIGFLRRAKEIQRPLFGICFGHQLMAEAFGGRTAKAATGWGLGVQDYASSTAAVEGAGQVLAFHQDQVEVLPSHAEVLAGTSHCPHGVLRYTFPALSVQYHPEFTPAYVEALLRRYDGELFDRSKAQEALAGLREASLANGQIASWAAQFLRSGSLENDLFESDQIDSGVLNASISPGDGSRLEQQPQSNAIDSFGISFGDRSIK